MSAGLHRVTIGLTQEELSRLDHYRERVRLPRGTALRIAAMETIPEVPAGSPGEADTPELPADRPGKADTPEPAADQPKVDMDIINERLRRMGQQAGVSSASEPAADQPEPDIDERIRRMGQELRER